PPRHPGTPGRARAVARERFSPPSERSRRKAQRPQRQGAGGGTGKAKLRSSAAAASRDAAAAAGGRVRRHHVDGGRRAPGARGLAALSALGPAAKEDRRGLPAVARGPAPPRAGEARAVHRLRQEGGRSLQGESPGYGGRGESRRVAEEG